MARKKDVPVASRAGVRHGSLRRSRAWVNAGKVLLTGLITVALSGVAVGAYAVWGLMQDVDTFELVEEDPTADAIDAGSQEIDGAFSVLLVGSDSRKGQSIDDGEQGELNDVNLLLHVAKNHKSATVMSFPRDLMLPIPSCPGPNGEPEYYGAMSEQQLNTTLMYGGLPCTVLTIENLTGFDIDYAGLITFDGVIAMSNAIGGVKVCLAQDIVDPKTNLNLRAGMNTLKGTKALQFLRTRAGVGDGSDISRISNQQVFMSAMVRQLKSAETLANPVKVYALANAGLKNMRLSKSMASIEFMQALAGTVKDIDLDRINFVQYPTYAHPYQSGRVAPDYAAAEHLIKLIKKGKPFKVTDKGRAVVDNPDADDKAAKEPADESGSSSTEPTKKPDKVSEVGGNITGQSAADETCSAGRTIY
ncbi:MAG: LCP family protein [Leucobacter sp.]|nr:LCP family protein [Leucobacter sp.]